MISVRQRELLHLVLDAVDPAAICGVGNDEIAKCREIVNANSEPTVASAPVVAPIRKAIDLAIEVLKDATTGAGVRHCAGDALLFANAIVEMRADLTEAIKQWEGWACERDPTHRGKLQRELREKWGIE